MRFGLEGEIAHDVDEFDGRCYRVFLGRVVADRWIRGIWLIQKAGCIIISGLVEDRAVGAKYG